jgi:hypothetical protein
MGLLDCSRTIVVFVIVHVIFQRGHTAYDVHTQPVICLASQFANAIQKHSAQQQKSCPGRVLYASTCSLLQVYAGILYLAKAGLLLQAGSFLTQLLQMHALPGDL